MKKHETKEVFVFQQTNLNAVRAADPSLPLRDALLLLSQNEEYLMSSFERLNSKYNNAMSSYHMAQLIDEDALDYCLSQDEDYSSIIYKLWLYAKRSYRRHYHKDGLRSIDYMEIVDLAQEQTYYEVDEQKPFVYCPKFRTTSIKRLRRLTAMVLKGFVIPRQYKHLLGGSFEIVTTDDAEYTIKKRIMLKILKRKFKELV